MNSAKVGVSIDKYRLKKLIAELKKKEGRGTQLISLYIPPGRRISEIIAYLREEYSTASNIKSDHTRKNVQDAILKILERLKYYHQTPQNGLVVFCGAVSYGQIGDERMEIYVIEPPEPLNVSLYRCDDHFHVEYLEDLLREKDLYGLISIDINEAAVGLLEGRRLEVIGSYTSGIPGKHRAGGQSARRFERLREMEIHHYFDRVATHVNEAFLKPEVYERLKGIIVGGPGFTKHSFVEESKLDYRLKQKILHFVDTNYSGEDGLREIIERGKEVLKDARYVFEKSLVDEFMSRVSFKHEMVLYGLNEIMRNLSSGIIDTILVLDDFEYYYIKLTCDKCNYAEEKSVSEEDLNKVRSGTIVCPQCKVGKLLLEESKLLVDYLYEVSDEKNFKVVTISPKNEYGLIFKQFGGIGALLKYPIHYRSM